MKDKNTINYRGSKPPRKPDPKAVERRKKLEAVLDRKRKLDELL